MRTRLVYLGLLCLVCILLSLVVDLFYFPPHLIFPDEDRILRSATRLAATGEFWVGSDRAWEMPGTALYFAPAVWLFGSNTAVLPIRIAQSILLAAQCILIAITAERLVGKGAAIIAACIVALYPFFLFYQGLLLSETLFNTLLLAA